MVKDEYALTDFFVNLTMDAAKLAVSVGVAWGGENISDWAYGYGVQCYWHCFWHLCYWGDSQSFITVVG